MRGISITFVALLAVFVAACGGEQPDGDAEGGSGGVQPGEQPEPTEGLTTVGDALPETTPGAAEEAAGTRADERELEAYAKEVRPVVEGTLGDLSEVVEAEVGIDDGRPTLGLDVGSVERARDEVEGRFRTLEAVEPPDELEGVHDRILSSYRSALAAQGNVIESIEAGEPPALADVVEDDLSRIARASEELEVSLGKLESVVE